MQSKKDREVEKRSIYENFSASRPDLACLIFMLLTDVTTAKDLQITVGLTSFSEAWRKIGMLWMVTHPRIDLNKRGLNIDPRLIKTPYY